VVLLVRATPGLRLPVLHSAANFQVELVTAEPLSLSPAKSTATQRAADATPVRSYKPRTTKVTPPRPANVTPLPPAPAYQAPSPWTLGAPGHELDLGPDEATGTGVRGALRASVGCAHPDFVNLTKAELDECHRVFGVQAAIGAKAYVDPIKNARKRAYYDRVKDAYDRIHHYQTPLDDDVNNSAQAPTKYGEGVLTEELRAKPP
jgi:hypothetical protein